MESEYFNMRLDKGTRENLDILAKRHHRSRADVIRLMINIEAGNPD